MFRFVGESSEWKERGTGDVRLLQHNETNKVRLVMRRDKTLKVCANHYSQSSLIHPFSTVSLAVTNSFSAVTQEMALSPNVGSDRSWVYNVAADVCDGETSSETLAIRFANSESKSPRPPCNVVLTLVIATDAGLFKSAFLSAQETNKSLLSSNSAAPQEAVPADEPAAKEEVKEDKPAEAVEEKKEAPVEDKKEVVEEVRSSFSPRLLKQLSLIIVVCGCVTDRCFCMIDRPLKPLPFDFDSFCFVRISFLHPPLSTSPSRVKYTPDFSSTRDAGLRMKRISCRDGNLFFSIVLRDGAMPYHVSKETARRRALKSTQ